MEVSRHALVMLGVRDVIEALPGHLLHEDVPRLGMLEDLGEARLGTDRGCNHDLARGAARPKGFEHRVAPVEDVHPVSRGAV